MTQYRLISLLDKVLQQSSKIRKGCEAVYYCPFCHHYKRKLEINLNTEEWQCWVCHARGTKIRNLFYSLNVDERYYIELSHLTNDKPVNPHKEKEHTILSLPPEFISLKKKINSLEFNNAIRYLNKRKVNYEDIIRYNIGYCEDGEYKHRIIIPSYDKNGNINFFSARAYYDCLFKYKLPPWSKNIIGFELFINWKDPITIVEGGFDAIAVRKNAIPLFGTTISESLKLALVEYNVNNINIMLDNDAIKNAIEIYNVIYSIKPDSNINVIKLEEKDPSNVGYKKNDEILKEAKPLDFSDMIKMKINYKL